MRSVLIAVLVFVVTTGASLADYNRSKAWFHDMTYQERIRTQFLLVFTGDYTGLVDGTFGPLTYTALTSFQEHREHVPDGVPDARQILILQRDGLDLVRRVGFETIHETESGLTLGVPAKLFEPASATRRGRHWLAHDSSIELETWRVPREETDYQALYRRAIRPQDGRVVASKNFRNDYFIVSGQQDGRSFYLRVMKTPQDSRGFSLSWEPKHTVFMNRVAIAMSSSMTGIVAGDDSSRDSPDDAPEAARAPRPEGLNSAAPKSETVISRSAESGTGS
ncbi:peptidoglycan-binding domain-containing protein [uncultured Roseibium sp.]|uniref:peptidoglycan-binding domain-containing protein n=1 Tax=uncultured Roseibium sp. TaxID=1936171 RepID=UPI002601E0B1|nr:peptidoglycan-binding domain-containing protein [uncultured Roseibium sp.]